jgi:hypothetical protein
MGRTFGGKSEWSSIWSVRRRNGELDFDVLDLHLPHDCSPLERQDRLIAGISEEIVQDATAGES